MPKVATVFLRELQLDRRPDKIVVRSQDILTEVVVLLVSTSDERCDGTTVEDRREHGKSLTLSLFTAPPIRAGPGYELRRGVGYYKIHTEPKTWHEARQICEQEGAHLAVINSEEESKVLQSLFAPVAAKLKATWAFVGFHDLYNEGQYLTIFGT